MRGNGAGACVCQGDLLGRARDYPGFLSSVPVVNVKRLMTGKLGCRGFAKPAQVRFGYNYVALGRYLAQVRVSRGVF